MTAPAWSFGAVSAAAAALLAASSWEVDRERWTVVVLCPASATFDAAEALRLELVAAAPPGVAVDVEIAAGGGGSAEDEAGRRLFAAERARRMAGRCPPLSDDDTAEG